MSKFNKCDRARRNNASGRLLGLSLAAALSFAATSVFAQSEFDFEDPMDQMRAKIEKVEPAGAATSREQLSSAATARGDALAAPDVKDPLARISEKFGLPVLGLVALAGLTLLACLLGLMWLLGGFKRPRTKKREDGELYAVADGTRGRRELESGSKITRNRKKSLDTRETADVAKPSAAAAAAAIISDQNEDYDRHDDYVRDEDDYVVEAAAEPSYAAPAAAVAEDETASWRRPNLDRLKASIRDDWQSKDEAPKAAATEPETNYQPEPETNYRPDSDTRASSLRDESENFASLFGNESKDSRAELKTTSPVRDMLGTSGVEDTLSASDLRAAVEKTADVRKLEKAQIPAAANKTSRDDAIRRIRALRESVKAS